MLATDPKCTKFKQVPPKIVFYGQSETPLALDPDRPGQKLTFLRLHE